jgi:electron transfer flavoprotein beta subunit
MKAKKKPVDVKTIADLGIEAASVGEANRKVKVKALNFPPERQAVKIIEGETAQEQAAELVRVLHEEAKVI